jgi:hypothetical protein
MNTHKIERKLITDGQNKSFKTSVTLHPEQQRAKLRDKEELQMNGLHTCLEEGRTEDKTHLTKAKLKSSPSTA